MGVILLAGIIFCCLPADSSHADPLGKILQFILDVPRYQELFGTGVVYWTTDNMPEGYKNSAKAAEHMTTITVPIWVRGIGGSKKASSRSLTINSVLAEDVAQIFQEIYELPEKFPVDTLTGFRWNDRGEVSGPFLENVTCMSAHAYGAAIDINYFQNDYYVGKGNDLRDKTDPYYITDNVKNIFLKHGWYWGGDYAVCSDTMHFQYTGLGMLSYNNGSPFTEYRLTKVLQKSLRILNVQRRLQALGYDCGGADGIFGEKMQKAVSSFQRDNGLKVTGTTTEEFYILLYNITHSMNDFR